MSLKSFEELFFSRQLCQLLLRLGISNANMSHRCTEGHLKLRRWQSHGMWQRQSSDGGNVTWWHYVSLQETSITHNPGKSSSVNTTVRLLPTERNQVLWVQNMLRCCKWTVKKLTWYYLIRTRWASSSASVCWLRCSGVFAPVVEKVRSQKWRAFYCITTRNWCQCCQNQQKKQNWKISNNNPRTF